MWSALDADDFTSTRMHERAINWKHVSICKKSDCICYAFYRNLLRLNLRLQWKFKCSQAVTSNQLKCRFCKKTRRVCVCHFFKLRRFWMCSSYWCGWRLTMMRKRNELWGNQLTQFRCNWKRVRSERNSRHRGHATLTANCFQSNSNRMTQMREKEVKQRKTIE